MGHPCIYLTEIFILFFITFFICYSNRKPGLRFVSLVVLPSNFVYNTNVMSAVSPSLIRTDSWWWNCSCPANLFVYWIFPLPLCGFFIKAYEISIMVASLCSLVGYVAMGWQICYFLVIPSLVKSSILAWIFFAYMFSVCARALLCENALCCNCLRLNAYDSATVQSICVGFYFT